MQADAAFDLFFQLKTFSTRLAARIGLKNPLSPNGRPAFTETADGCIIHYTADPDFQNVARWFCNPQSQASAHFIVGASRYTWAFGLDTDLPRVAALPATVMLVRPLDAEACHSTWANRWAYGIELCNTGEVRPSVRGIGYVWWPNDWKTPYDARREPLGLFGRLWEPFTLEQTLATQMIVSALHCRGKGLQPAKVVGHENVQGTLTVGCGGHDKRDPGPGFHLDWLRRGLASPASQDELVLFLANAEGAAQWRKKAVYQALGAAAAGTNPMRTAMDLIRSPTALFGDPKLQKLALALLGYHADASAIKYDADERQSLVLFQTLMGLKGDGVAGPRTQDALSERYVDRFAAAPPSVA